MIFNFYCDRWDDYTPVYWNLENPPGGSHYNWAISYKILMTQRTDKGLSTSPFSVVCPSKTGELSDYYDKITYGLNPYIAKNKSGTWGTERFKRGQLKRPALSVVHGDRKGQADSNFEYPTNIGYFHGTGNRPNPNAAANFVFADGHVETLTYSDQLKASSAVGYFKYAQTYR